LSIRPRLWFVGIALWYLAVACTQTESTVTPTTLPTPATTATSTPVLTITQVPSHRVTPMASPPPTRSPTPHPLTPLFDQILEKTSAIRGLEPLTDVTPMFMTREELSASLRQDMENDRGDILKSEALLKILGLIPSDADLYRMLLELYGEQVMGFYDPDAQELYMIQDIEEFTPIEEATLAHEYTHALQQQHFDIHTMSEETEEDSEASAALSALIEGDASAVQFEYMFTHFTSRQLQGRFDDDGDSAVFDASPYFLQQSLLFPYAAGLDLMDAILRSGQWDVDSAWADPPVSTEQVLHPDKYFQGELPVAVALPDVATVLAQGWREVYTDVIGEFTLRTYLETRTGEGAAASAAAGWGGDRFALLEGPQGERVLVTLLSWDTVQDAWEFFDALESSDSVSDEGYLALQEDQVLWIISPSSSLTYEIMVLFPEF
jgi:hypothetical protein